MLKVFESFAGVGSQRMALRNLGIEHEVVGISEIDGPAVLSYAAIHTDFLEKRKNIDKYVPSEIEMREFLRDINAPLDYKTFKSKVDSLKGDKLKEMYLANALTKNYGDITKIEPSNLPDMDLFTYSFPCQDLSVAGKQKGLEVGTRSGLLYECEKIIETKRPKYLLLENVKNLVGKKFKPAFDKWLEYLDSIGYDNFYQVLNAKDYGIPQNRERIFVVSVRKDVSKKFTFPTKRDLDRRLKDVLENTVDEKYYINTERARALVEDLGNRGFLGEYRVPCDSTLCNPKELEIANCITARYDAGIQNKPSIGVAVAERIGGLFDDETKHQAGPVWDSNKLAPTLDTMQGGYRQPCIVASRGRNKDNPSLRVVGDDNLEQRLEVNSQGISNTLTNVQKDNYVLTESYRIRKLTPKECWRLMGFIDEDFYKAERINSNTQLYKQAGNSIVVNVLEGIFESLFLD